MDCKASFATSPAPTGFAPLLFAGDVPAAAKAAAELGFEGIEISMKGPEELRPRLSRAFLDRYDLELTAVASGRIYIDERATLSDPDEGARMRVVNRVKRLIEFAGEFGAPVIVGLLRGERLVDGDARQDYLSVRARACGRWRIMPPSWGSTSSWRPSTVTRPFS